MAVRGLLDGGSVMARRTRAFAVASEMGLGGVSVVGAAAGSRRWVSALTRGVG